MITDKDFFTGGNRANRGSAGFNGTVTSVASGKSSPRFELHPFDP